MDFLRILRDERGVLTVGHLERNFERLQVRTS